MKVYSSPDAVFDAYRQAHRSGNWRSFYFLFTLEVQRDMVFEAQFACGEVDGPALEAIQKKLGPTETETGKKYFEAYKRKHGHGEVIDKFLAKAIPHWEAKDREAAGAKAEAAGTATPPEEAALVEALPNDEELNRQAIYDATKDKVGFFEEVQKVLENGRNSNIIGDLRQVDIKDDKATGRAEITIVPTPGETPPKSGGSRPPYDKPFKFRRINGGWLLDSL